MYWGTPDNQTATLAEEDTAGFNIVGETKQSYREPFALYADNVAGWMFFQEVCDQWRYSATGQVLGVDYPAIESIMNMRGILDKEDLFKDIRAIEFGARTAINAKGK